ncbi:uncharacterized protein [Euwallacea fornicatus]|uniref:uncharacterized protein n=1 Tax=Euwallacea fornicatus TaxID=995702 RepID=UPI00339054A4
MKLFLPKDFFIYFAAFAVNLLSYSGGLGYGWSSPALPKLSGSENNPLPRPVTINEESWIASLLSLGAMVCPFVTEFFSEKIGRKKTLILFSLPMIVGNFIIIFANRVVHFYVARFLIGLTEGSIFSIVPVYSAEISENHNRGTIGAMLLLFVSLGHFTCSLVLPHVTIRVFSILSLIPTLLFVLIFSLLVPESPYFYLLNGKSDEAKDSLRKLRQKHDVEDEFDEISKAVVELRGSVEINALKELFTVKSSLKAFGLALILMMLQQFTGLIYIIDYTQKIFDSAATPLAGDVSTILVTLVQVISIASFTNIIDRVKRRILLLVSVVVIFSLQIAMGTFFCLQQFGFNLSLISWLPVACLMLYIIAFQAGIGPISYIFPAEVLQPNVKSLGVTMVISLGLLAEFGIATLFPMVANSVGFFVPFWIFACASFLAIVFIWLYVPETTGKSFLDIQESIRNKSSTKVGLSTADALGKIFTRHFPTSKKGRLPGQYVALRRSPTSPGYRTVNLITFSTGGCWSWTSPILPMLSSNDSDINPLPRPTTTLENSWIAGTMNLGALVGPLAGGFCSEKLGKKRALLVFGLPIVISHTLSAFAISVHFFLVARFLIGMAAGTVFAVLPGYIGDIAEDKNRGLLGSMLGVFNSCGILFTYTVGPFISVRTFSLINLIAPMAFYFIFGLFVPDSPYDLIKRGRKAEAEVSLMKLRGKRTSGDIQKELTYITDTIQTCSSVENAGFMALFKNKALIRAMLISNGLMVFQQLSGICAVIGYMQTIFEMTGSSLPSTYSAILIGFVQLLSNMVSAQLVEKAGRKLLIIISCAFSMFSLITLGGYFLMLSSGMDVSEIGWLPITSLIIFIVAFNLGLANLPWVILAEVFPSNTRAVSSTFTTFFSFTLSFLVTICFPVVNEALGMTATFWIFAGVLLIGFVFSILVVPETKGKSSQEIQNMLEGIQK